MAEDNKLEDLILEEPETKGNRQKGVLVILGLVVLLLIIGVVLINVIFNSNEDSNKSTESIKDEIVQKVDKKNNLLSQNNDIKKDDTLNIDDDLAPIDEKDNLEADLNEKKEDNVKDEIITGASVVTAGAAAVTAKKQIDKAQNNMRDEILEEEPKKVEKRVKRVVKKEHKVKVKPKVKHIRRVPKNTITYSGNVYIQVGSFSKGPNEAFINKIRRAGFRYRIKEVNGYRRVLIGPFRNANEASRYLGTVRAKVSRTAFIKR